MSYGIVDWSEEPARRQNELAIWQDIAATASRAESVGVGRRNRIGNVNSSIVYHNITGTSRYPLTVRCSGGIGTSPKT